MKRIILLLLLAGCCACGRTGTKISAWPKKIGIHKNQTLVMMPLEGVDEHHNEGIMRHATGQFSEKLPTLQVKNYWDADYARRQAGLTVPTFANPTSAESKLFYSKLNVDFILVSKLVLLRENDWGDKKHNPVYNVRQANLRLKLIDTKRKAEVWSCETRTAISPLDLGGDRPVNLASATGAIGIAYKKSIKRLIRSSVLVSG